MAGTLLNNAGKDLISGLLVAATWYNAWGTGAGATAATNTTLSTESADEARVSTTDTQQTTTVTDDTFQAIATMTCAVGGKTITNAGVFDAAAAGNMLCSTDGIATTLAVSDSIQFTWQLKFA